MSILFTANTPWVLYAAQALRCSAYRREPAHLLIINKRDGHAFRRSFDCLLLNDLWDSIHVFQGEYLSKLLSEVLHRPADLLQPFLGRRRIAPDLQEIAQVLHQTDPQTVILGNKWQAPEGFIYHHQRQRGRQVGFLEEGLSVYLTTNYWEPRMAQRVLRNAVYFYHGVTKYYRHSDRHFDFAWLGLPPRYALQDVDRKLALFENLQGFQEVATRLARAGDIGGFLARLDPGAPLILSQRLSEDGLVSEEEENRVLDRVVDHLLQCYPRVYIKPHPRDRADKVSRLISRHGSGRVESFGFEHYPIEALMFFWRPPLLLGFLSGTLVYSTLMFGIHSFSLIDLLPRKNPGLETFRQAASLCSKFDLPEAVAGRAGTAAD